MTIEEASVGETLSLAEALALMTNIEAKFANKGGVNLQAMSDHPEIFRMWRACRERARKEKCS